MKKIILSLLLIPISMLSISQIKIEAIQAEINQTVWKPFQNAFQNLDADALNAVYADKTLRVTPEGIDTEDAFKKDNINRFKDSKEGNVSIKLDFWFDDRKTNETTSYEVGFYRIAATVNGQTNNSYGQFHIVLKKINGVWKITQDWDTTTINGDVIGKEDFEKHKPILLD